MDALQVWHEKPLRVTAAAPFPFGCDFPTDALSKEKSPEYYTVCLLPLLTALTVVVVDFPSLNVGGSDNTDNNGL